MSSSIFDFGTLPFEMCYPWELKMSQLISAKTEILQQNVLWKLKFLILNQLSTQLNKNYNLI